MTIYTSLLAADDNSNAGSSSSASLQQPWQQQLSQQQQQQQGVVLMKAASWMGVGRSDVLMGVNTLVASRLMSQVCPEQAAGRVADATEWKSHHGMSNVLWCACSADMIRSARSADVLSCAVLTCRNVVC
jgi:hypothetical protein